jgi:DNA-binding GntR family transcriptional regulator
MVVVITHPSLPMARNPRSPVTQHPSPTHPASSPDRVAAAITKGLLHREYVVGQRLVEADLIEKLEVSRSTVREALKILASRGIVEIVPYRGAIIRGLTQSDARDLLAVLEALTGLAAKLAAENICIGQNSAMFAAAAKPLVQPRPTEELERILDERARFYQSIFDIAGNEELNRAMPTWRAHLFRTQMYSKLTKADLKAMVAEYRQISEAILEGDGRRAEMWARKHLQKSGERSLPHLR